METEMVLEKQFWNAKQVAIAIEIVTIVNTACKKRARDKLSDKVVIL